MYLGASFFRFQFCCCTGLVIFTNYKAFSGSEVSILAVGCCVAIKKLDPACISCPSFTGTLQDIIWEVLEASPDFSSDVLHQISTKLGVEREFLACFGSKILHPHSRGNMIFWIGLLQEKLVAALSRESVVTILRFFCHSEVSFESCNNMDISICPCVLFFKNDKQLPFV